MLAGLLALLYAMQSGKSSPVSKSDLFLDQIFAQNWITDATCQSLVEASRIIISKCDSDGAIIELFLSGASLTGSIPPLSFLPKLEILQLSSNMLTGTIPPLNANTALQSFKVIRNQLSGGIPSLNLDLGLKYFETSFNQMNKGLPTLSANTALISFKSYNNLHTGPVPLLASNPALVEFEVGNNQLTGSLSSLSYNIKLKRFMIGNNNLTGTMPSLTSNKALYNLRLDNNALSSTGVPGSCPSCRTMAYCVLSGNNFHYIAPEYTRSAGYGTSTTCNAACNTGNITDCKNPLSPAPTTPLNSPTSVPSQSPSSSNATAAPTFYSIASNPSEPDVRTNTLIQEQRKPFKGQRLPILPG